MNNERRCVIIISAKLNILLKLCQVVFSDRIWIWSLIKSDSIEMCVFKEKTAPVSSISLQSAIMAHVQPPVKNLFYKQNVDTVLIMALKWAPL